jgi:hypothetical protein
MIFDGSYIFQIIDQWEFGLDNAGYLMDINNTLHIVNESRNRCSPGENNWEHRLPERAC